MGQGLSGPGDAPCSAPAPFPFQVDQKAKHQPVGLWGMRGPLPSHILDTLETVWL